MKVKSYTKRIREPSIDVLKKFDIYITTWYKRVQKNEKNDITIGQNIYRVL